MNNTAPAQRVQDACEVWKCLAGRLTTGLRQPRERRRVNFRRSTTCCPADGEFGFWVMQLPIRRLVLSCILQLTGFPPGSQLVRVRVDRSALVVELPMYRHSFPLLPTTDCLFTAMEPGCDFLLGVQGSRQLLANCIPG